MPKLLGSGYSRGISGTLYGSSAHAPAPAFAAASQLIRGSSASFFAKNVLTSHGSDWVAGAALIGRVGVRLIDLPLLDRMLPSSGRRDTATDTSLMLTFSIGWSTRPAMQDRVARDRRPRSSRG